MAAALGVGLPGEAGEGHRLHRQHREYAGHQIEEHAAEEGQRQDARPERRGVGFQRAGGGREVIRRLGAGAIAQDQHAGQAGGGLAVLRGFVVR